MNETPEQTNKARKEAIAASAVQVCESAREGLLNHILKSLDHLTHDEIDRISRKGNMPVRAAHTLLCAVGPDSISLEWNTESGKADVAFVKRVLRRNR